MGDEITFIQPILSDSWDKVDFAFFCGSRDMTLTHWQKRPSGPAPPFSTSPAPLKASPESWCARPWLETDASPADLLTPATVPAHPAALALALLLGRLQQAAPMRTAAVTMLVPASEFGRTAMDELHQQTVNLLSFQTLPRAIYDAQAAYQPSLRHG